MVVTVDDFIDVIMKDHRKYIKWSVDNMTETSTDNETMLY